MKRMVLILAFILTISIEMFSQPAEGVVFGGGIRVGLPVSDFKAFTSFGIGAELQAEYGFSDLISGIGTMGYTRFLGKDYGAGKTKATGYIPILVGTRIYPINRLFIGAQIGYGILTSGSSSEGAFNYQLQIGYNASGFQIAFHYNSLSEKNSALSHLALTGIFKF